MARAAAKLRRRKRGVFVWKKSSDKQDGEHLTFQALFKVNRLKERGFSLDFVIDIPPCLPWSRCRVTEYDGGGELTWLVVVSHVWHCIGTFGGGTQSVAERPSICKY